MTPFRAEKHTQGVDEEKSREGVSVSPGKRYIMKVLKGTVGIQENLFEIIA